MIIRSYFFKGIFALLISILFFVDANGCTSAIFTGKATADGRPLMWKNRDTDHLENRLEFFKKNSKEIKYDFVGLVNSSSNWGEVWAGNNEVGFCIMNTASYNIDIKEDRDFEKDGEGMVMFRALAVCKTLKDFEYFLDTLSKPAPIEANFGVIDAYGGAAYYEVNSRTWVKRDANDPTLAPNGYLIVTNFSFTGREDQGMGYIRHTSAEHIINEAFNNGVKFTPDWIMNNLSRSFYHSLLGVDVVKSGLIEETNGWFVDQDFISRKSTSAISIFQGVKEGEDPLNTIYWCALGYGPLAINVPIFTKFLPELPKTMVYFEQVANNQEYKEYSNKYSKLKKNYSLLNFLILEVKKDIFPIKRGNGQRYVNIGKLYNSQNRGYTQQIVELEKELSKENSLAIEKLRNGTLSKQDVYALYNDSRILDLYKGFLEN